MTALTRRPDGSIVAAGTAPPARTTGFLAAVSPQGALVGGFGKDGIVRLRDPRPADLTLAGFVPLPGGKVLGLGTTDLGIAEAPVLVGFTAGNRLDPSFGDGSGYVILREAQGYSPHGATGFAVHGGKALTGVYDYPRSHLLMARTDDGSPVASFGSGGTVELPKGLSPRAVAFSGAGDPLVLARRQISGPYAGEAGVILRLDPAGARDRGFRRGGTYTMRLGRQVVRGESLLAGPRGRILAAGSLGRHFAIVSLLPSGGPDPSFGTDGWSEVTVDGPAHYVTMARVGGWIYAAGAVGERGGDQEVVLVRLDRHGHLDRGFGHDGRMVAPVTREGPPVRIVPRRKGVLVVLATGRRPLLTFTAGGGVRREALGGRPLHVENVWTSAAGGTTVFGWKSGSGTYHLSRQARTRSRGSAFVLCSRIRGARDGRRPRLCGAHRRSKLLDHRNSSSPAGLVGRWE